MAIDIKKAVSGKVYFQYYKNGNLWYRTESDDLFPVPVSDIGTATFYAEDKGILFMRYMKKWNGQV